MTGHEWPQPRVSPGGRRRVRDNRGMTPAPPGDGGRLAQGQRTRLGILQVAREQFHRLGYDGASIRSIAAAADIDPSMVMRYYGSKEGLFAAAMDIDLRLPATEVRRPHRQPRSSGRPST
jgi:AcrR family transcriptional regulator